MNDRSRAIIEELSKRGRNDYYDYYVILLAVRDGKNRPAPAEQIAAEWDELCKEVDELLEEYN